MSSATLYVDKDIISMVTVIEEEWQWEGTGLVSFQVNSGASADVRVCDCHEAIGFYVYPRYEWHQRPRRSHS